MLLMALIVFSAASILQAQEVQKRYEKRSITIDGVTYTQEFAVYPPGTMADQTVTNTNDAGAGSFRQALTDVHDGGTINFNITGSDVISVLFGGSFNAAFLQFGKRRHGLPHGYCLQRWYGHIKRIKLLPYTVCAVKQCRHGHRGWHGHADYKRLAAELIQQDRFHGA